MYCRSCGNIMSDREKVCPSCGTPVHSQEKQNQRSYGFQRNEFDSAQSTPNQSRGYGYQSSGQSYRQPRPSVGFGAAIRGYFAGYTNFSGRARRSEYWLAMLFVYMVNFTVGLFLPDLTSLATMLFLVPNIALTVRRLHDVGKRGFYYLWSFLPVIGTVILLIQLCKDSEGDNIYGPSPKY